MTTRVTCPHCGGEIEVNAGKILASIETDKRKKASRENGKKGGRPRKNGAKND